jgi:hypothetical protein
MSGKKRLAALPFPAKESVLQQNFTRQPKGKPSCWACMTAGGIHVLSQAAD